MYDIEALRREFPQRRAAYFNHASISPLPQAVLRARSTPPPASPPIQTGSLWRSRCRCSSGWRSAGAVS